MRHDPHLDRATGIFVYRKSWRYADEIFVSDCCLRVGSLCPACASLNTSSFYDLDVPLHPTYFDGLKGVLIRRHGWAEHQFHGWLSFWLRSLAMRHSYSKQLIFFEYEKFFYMRDHDFFVYLYKSVAAIPPITTHDTAFHLEDDRVLVTTADATIRATLHIYGIGGRATGITTFRRRTLTTIFFSTTPDARSDQLGIWKAWRSMRERRAWRDAFRHVVREIDNEVKFRPGMCGMEECQASFHTGVASLR